MTILVRNVEKAECDWLLALNNDAVPHVSHLERESLGDLMAMACYARLVSIDDQLLAALIAFWPGTDYQSANYRWFSERFDHFLYVDRVIVADGARGKGVGQVLYDDLERFANGRTTKIALEVNSLPPNPASMRFHQAAGFVDVGEQVHDGGEKKVVMMVKTLGAGPGHPQE